MVVVQLFWVGDLSLGPVLGEIGVGYVLGLGLEGRVKMRKGTGVSMLLERRTDMVLINIDIYVHIHALWRHRSHGEVVTIAIDAFGLGTL